MIQRFLEANELVKPVQDFRMLRLLNVLIDAWADHNWAIWETALLADERQSGGRDREGWNDAPAKKTLSEWGVVDQHGVYLLAGLTKAEREVAFLHYDRCLESAEIGRLLGRDPVTVRVQLHKARERLRRLAA